MPGTRTDWLPKARAAGADAVILDLEDAVPEDGKASAREQVAHVIERIGPETADRTAGHPAILVRINPLDGWTAAEELRAIVGPGLAGIVLPKVDGAHDVRHADRLDASRTWARSPAPAATSNGPSATAGARVVRRHTLRAPAYCWTYVPPEHPTPSPDSGHASVTSTVCASSPSRTVSSAIRG